MIPTPFRFEPELTPDEFMKLGQLSLRWSHIEHMIGNCLRVMLRLSDAEAVAVVFPLTLETRLQRMNDLAEIAPLNSIASAAFSELKPIMKGIQYVRNNVIRAAVLSFLGDVAARGLVEVGTKVEISNIVSAGRCAACVAIRHSGRTS